MSPPKRRRIILILGVSALALFVLSWEWVQTWFGRVYDDRRFDQKVWLANPDPAPDNLVRARMVDDLIEHLKPSMTKADVQRLLGKEGYDAEREDDLPGSELTYNIGTYSNRQQDLGYVVVLFDAKGRYDATYLFTS